MLATRGESRPRLATAALLCCGRIRGRCAFHAPGYRWPGCSSWIVQRGHRSADILHDTRGASVRLAANAIHCGPVLQQRQHIAYATGRIYSGAGGGTAGRLQ